MGRILACRACDPSRITWRGDVAKRRPPSHKASVKLRHPTRQFYDSSTGPHHHFYNVDTGELTDIPLESVVLQVDAALPPGTEQAGVDVVVRVRGRAG